MNLKKIYRIASLLLIWAVLIGGLGAGTAISGENENKTTQPYVLGEVVVTADQPADKATTMFEVTGEEIEMQNAQTLDQALKLIPGLDVRTGNAGIPRVNIRGFRSRHTILLLNGVPMNSTYDGQFDPRIIPTANIARIKVSFGTHSVLYGQGGMAGVINIITRQGTQGLHVDVSAQVDERGSKLGKASVSGGKDNVDCFVSMVKKESKGFLMSDDFEPTTLEDGNLRENTDAEQRSLFGNITFELGEDSLLGLTVENSSGEFGIPPTVADDKKSDFYKKAKYERVNDFNTFSSQVSYSFDPDSVFGFRTWVFVNEYDEDRGRYDDNSYSKMKKKGSYEGTNESAVQGFTLQPHLDFGGKGILTASLSAEKDEYRSWGEKVLKKNEKATPYSSDNDLDLYSTALEYKIRMLDRLDLVAGYGHHWQNRTQGQDDDKGSYMLGASIEIMDGTTLMASYARKIRFPSIRQLYDTESGNSDLTVEQSDNYEIGVIQDICDDLELSVSVYQSDVKDYIEKLVSTDLYENNDKYRFKGVDLLLTRSIPGNGTLSAGYSYLDSEDRSVGAQRDVLQNRPKHMVKLAASFSFDFGLTAHADFIRVMEQYYYSDDFDKGKLEDYSILNFRFEQKVLKDNLSLFLGVDNLLDENYEEGYGLPQAGRTAYAGVRVTY